MYIQFNKNTNKDSQNARFYPLLCEKYWQNGVAKTKVIANLSKLPIDIVIALSGFLKNKKEMLVALKDIIIKKSIDYGFIYILIVLMDKLRITELLQKILGEKANYIRLMIIGKIVTRGSKLSIFNWIHRNEHIANKLGIDLDKLKLDNLYDALEDLSNVQKHIEHKWNLYHKYIKDEIYLYDITSTYLEGEKNALAKFGYNRDGKKGKRQIVIGLLTTKNGFPLSIEVFEGNTTDQSTVIEQLEKIKKEYQSKDIIFVGDRGMKIRYNLEKMDEQDKIGIKYISALTLEQIRCLIEDNIFQLDLFSKKIAEVEHQDVRYILCYNEDLEIEKREKRNQMKNKFEEKIELIKLSYDNQKFKFEKNKNRLLQGDKNKKLVTQFSQKQLDRYKYSVQKCIEKYRMQKFFEIEITEDNFSLIFNFDNYSDSNKLDGKYVIVTNVEKEKLDKETVREQYKNLKHVEHAFRDLKTNYLEIRPVNHIKASTTKGHVIVCMFSYAIIREIEQKVFPWLKKFNKNNKRQLSFNDIEQELKMIKYNELMISNDYNIYKLTELSDINKEIFEILEINPENMLK